MKSCGWHPEGYNGSALQDFALDQTKIDSLIDELSQCKHGKKYFREYEKLCSKIIDELFLHEFSTKVDQHKTKDQLFRMDTICALKKSDSFWGLIRQYYNSHFVVFEYKNYSKKLEQNIIYTTEKYLFNAALRNVSIIISRKGFSENARVAASGCLKEHGKLILDITDDDLMIMLRKKKDSLNPADHLIIKMEEFLMSISK